MSSSPHQESQLNKDARNALTDRLMALGQMSSTETALFHQKASAKNGLSITDSKTLTVLMQEGAMTAGQLATRLTLTTGAVTSVIDRLEQAGLARRVSDPADRRRVIVELQPQNLAAIGKTYASMGASFQKLLASYSLNELKFLVRYYETVLEHTKSEIAKLG